MTKVVVCLTSHEKIFECGMIKKYIGERNGKERRNPKLNKPDTFKLYIYVHGETESIPCAKQCDDRYNRYIYKKRNLEMTKQRFG